MHLHLKIFAGLSLILLLSKPLCAQQVPDSRSLLEDRSQPDKMNSIMGYHPDIANNAGGDKPGRYIVKFTEPPSASNSFASQAAIRATHDQFIADLSRIESSLKLSATSQATILHEYKNAFNGFALTISSSTKAQIEKLPYVAGIVEDKEVKKTDRSSNTIINATRVWSEVGATGKNIKIGIIDTGIDYMHQDLGHGFGPGFKVEGGYDFVNEDNDPMDDEGHGTHVAGIAAANGRDLQGVAPDAKLYAYKALDANGSGFYSWILAAIEKTLDPDGNPGTDDALHVVNMSLSGSPLEPFDPLAEAVNNAVAQGVVYAVAAGNNGAIGYQTVYQSIGTPGIAQDAITVGATSAHHHIASFSSNGPTHDYRIKPDVTAPGVHIISSVPGNEQSPLDGTSMASPHVAGAAALILEEHANWTPQMIKSVLMGTASKNVGDHVWRNGSGLIDVLKAISSTVAVSPASISLGLTDFSSARWVQTKRITLQNLSDQSRVMGLTVTGEAITAGVSVQFSQPIVTVPASGSAEVDVTFTIDVNSLPAKEHLEPYVANIAVVSGAEMFKIPIAFVHARATPVQFTGQVPRDLIVLGVNGTRYRRTYDVLSNRFPPLLLPPGTYDLIATYPDGALVFKEDITPDLITPVIFARSDAKNTVSFRPLDEHGNPVPTTGNIIGRTSINSEEFSIFFSRIIPITISDIQKYRVEWRMAKASANNSSLVYDISASSPNGVSSSQVFSNTPADFTDITIKNPNVAVGTPQNFHYQLYFVTDVNPIQVSNPFTVKQSQNIRPQNKSLMRSFSRISSLDGNSSWGTGSWSVFDQSIVFGSLLSVREELVTVPRTDPFEYTLGGTLPHINGRVAYNHFFNQIYFSSFAVGFIDRSFGERENGLIDITLINNAGQTVMNHEILRNTSRALVNSDPPSSSFRSIEQLPEGSYTLKLLYNDYTFQGQAGSVKVDYAMNTSLADAIPPQLLSFDLFNENGAITNQIHANEHGIVQIQITDECDLAMGFDCLDPSGIASVVLEYKKSDAAEWTTLALAQANKTHLAKLPANLIPGSYALRLTATDNNANQVQQTIEPAFAVGPAAHEPLKKVTLLEPVSGLAHAGVSPTFAWVPMAGASTFTLHVSTTEDFTSLEVDVTQPQNRFVLNNPLDENTKYYWRVKANSGTTSGPWSAVNNFTTNDPFRISLIAPLNGSIDQPIKGNFRWEKDPEANVYTISISEDTLFTYDDDYTSLDTTFTFPLQPARTYYWKVRNANAPVSSTSETYSFTTVSPVVELVSPSNQAQNLPVNLTFTWEPLDNIRFYELSIVESPELPSNNVFLTTTSNTASVSGLAPNKNYEWSVRPFPGERSSRRTFNTNNAPPSVPQTLIAQGGDRQITLLWSAIPESNVASYKVYDVTNGSPTLLATVPAPANTFTHTGLANETTYSYQVSAVNNSGTEGARSAVVSASTLPPFITLSTYSIDNIPGIGTTGTVTVTSNVNWSAFTTSPDVTISNVTGTSFDYTVTENAEFTNRTMFINVQTTSIPVLVTPLALNQLPRPARFECGRLRRPDLTVLTHSSGTASVSWTDVVADTYALFYKLSSESQYKAACSGLTNRCIIVALQSGNAYDFKVQATRACQTPNGQPGTESVISEIRGLVLPSSPPTRLIPLSLDEISFSSSWAPSVGATSYRVDVSTDPSFSSGNIYTDFEVHGTVFTATGLRPDNVYHVRIRAVNPGGTSDNSPTFLIRTLVATCRTLMPPVITVLQLNTGSVTVHWTDVLPSGYTLEYKLSSATGYTTACSFCPGLDFTINGLLPGSTYNFKMSAFRICEHREGILTGLPGTDFVTSDIVTVTLPANTSSGLSGNDELITISPNPVKEGGALLLNVQTETAGIYDITIVNSYGELRQKQQLYLESGKVMTEIPVQGLPPSVYLLRLSTPSGQVKTVRFVKE